MIYRAAKYSGQEPGSFNVGDQRTSEPVLYYFNSTNFIAYDGVTGAIVLNNPGMAMNFYVSPYVYTYQGASGANSAHLISWTTAGSQTNFTNRILWNVTTNMPPSGVGILTLSSLPRPLAMSGLNVSLIHTTPAQILANNLTAINLATGAILYQKTPFDISNPNTYVYSSRSSYRFFEWFSVLSPVFPSADQGRGYVCL